MGHGARGAMAPCGPWGSRGMGPGEPWAGWAERLSRVQSPWRRGHWGPGDGARRGVEGVGPYEPWGHERDGGAGRERRALESAS